MWYLLETQLVLSIYQIILLNLFIRFHSIYVEFQYFFPFLLYAVWEFRADTIDRKRHVTPENLSIICPSGREQAIFPCNMPYLYPIFFMQLF
ncbi:hypothetical protein HNQ56_001350 [Anaerotaenia torta]